MSKESEKYTRRRRRLVKKLSVPAAIISAPEDVTYLSGFTGEDSWLLLGRGCGHLITDGRFTEQAQKQCPELEVHTRKKSRSKVCRKILSGRRIRRVAVQAEHLTIAARDSIARDMKGIRLVPAEGVVSGLRIIKDKDEICAIRRAVKVAQQAFARLLAGGVSKLIGRREREIAADLEYYMKLAGADGPSFPTIVAAGAHASGPHWRPDSTKLRADQVLLIDWGANVGGYCSDLTRVMFTGRIPPKLARMYRVVYSAQAAAIDAIRPGVAYKTVDAAAREVIDRAGFGDNFGHGIGHGLGLVVHDVPRLGPGLNERLRKGMVVTVEPGIYIPGLGGVRIEDDIEVTARGYRRLSKKARKL